MRKIKLLQGYAKNQLDNGFRKLSTSILFFKNNRPVVIFIETDRLIFATPPINSYKKLHTPVGKHNNVYFSFYCPNWLIGEYEVDEELSNEDKVVVFKDTFK